MSALKDLAAALAAGGVETPEEGFKTSQQFAEESGYGRSQSKLILAAAVEKGLAERRMFRVRTAGGVKAIPHYRVKL